MRHFYPRPPCGGRLVPQALFGFIFFISIHVPLAGDDRWGAHKVSKVRISIHVPLAGDDRNRPCGRFLTSLFLSTSPLRGTTPRRYKHVTGRLHFYPRPPCGGRPGTFARRLCRLSFLSTSPLRGTTGRRSPGAAARAISIHVPLAGDDAMLLMDA